MFQILKNLGGMEDDSSLGSYQHNNLELVFAVNSRQHGFRLQADLLEEVAHKLG